MRIGGLTDDARDSAVETTVICGSFVSFEDSRPVVAADAAVTRTAVRHFAPKWIYDARASTTGFFIRSQTHATARAGNIASGVIDNTLPHRQSPSKMKLMRNSRMFELNRKIQPPTIRPRPKRRVVRTHVHRRVESTPRAKSPTGGYISTADSWSAETPHGFADSDILHHAELRSSRRPWADRLIRVIKPSVSQSEMPGSQSIAVIRESTEG
jgi:hypothetical protein